MVIHHQHSIQKVFLVLYVTLLAYPNLVQAESPYGLLPSKQYKLGYLGFQSKWQSQWLQGKDRYLEGYWNASFYQPPSSLAHRPNNFSAIQQDIGLAAVLRFQRNDGTGFYAEAGTGPQYQSMSYDLARVQGSRFALNTLASIGFVWKNGVDLGFKAMHTSRGQGMDGNDGVSQVSVRMRYRW